MPRVGFESTILVFERAKTVHALGRSPTVIGNMRYYSGLKSYMQQFLIQDITLLKLIRNLRLTERDGFLHN
jgi:hypothetical protein